MLPALPQPPQQQGQQQQPQRTLDAPQNWNLSVPFAGTEDTGHQAAVNLIMPLLGVKCGQPQTATPPIAPPEVYLFAQFSLIVNRIRTAGWPDGRTDGGRRRGKERRTQDQGRHPVRSTDIRWRL